MQKRVFRVYFHTWKYVIMVLFVSPWMSLIPPLAIRRVSPPPGQEWSPQEVWNPGLKMGVNVTLKITFASTCEESVFNVPFNVLFLVLDFPLGAPNTLLKHVIERSIWRIVVGEGSWWGWGFSQVLVIGFLILLESFPDCGLLDWLFGCLF